MRTPQPHASSPEVLLPTSRHTGSSRLSGDPAPLRRAISPSPFSFLSRFHASPLTSRSLSLFFLAGAAMGNHKQLRPRTPPSAPPFARIRRRPTGSTRLRRSWHCRRPKFPSTLPFSDHEASASPASVPGGGRALRSCQRGQAPRPSTAPSSSIPAHGPGPSNAIAGLLCFQLGRSPWWAADPAPLLFFLPLLGGPLIWPIHVFFQIYDFPFFPSLPVLQNNP